MNYSKTIGSLPDNLIIKEFPDVERSVTAAELFDVSGRCAAWLQRQGYKHIAIHMGNCPELLFLFAGALRAGVKSEFLNVLKPAESEIPVFDQEKVRAILRESTDCRFTEYDWSDDEPIIVLLTSGTSGERKRVQKTFRNFLGDREYRSLWKLALKALHIRIYNATPWYHNTGMSLLLISMAGGIFTEVTTCKFNPERMREYINKTRPNCLLCTPTMIKRCASCGDVALPFLMLCCGEHMSTDTIRLLEETGGGQLLYTGYGSTELGGVSSMLYTFEGLRSNAKRLANLLGSLGIVGMVCNKNTFQDNCVGKLSKGVKVKVFSDGKEQAEGNVGEIAVAKKTKIDSIEAEFFDTGDLGYLRGEMLFIVGRKSNVINRSGEKIIPADIEEVIEKFSGVEDVVVFGLPSATHGEDICAAVKSRDGAAVFRKEDLAGKLPKFMIPQHVFFMEELPLNASGKKEIIQLKKLAQERISQASHAKDNA